MSRPWRLMVLLVVILAALSAAVAIFGRTTPATDPSPIGYRVVAQYFGTREGVMGKGLNLLTAAPQGNSEVRALMAQLRSGKNALLILQTSGEIGRIAPELRAVRGSRVATRSWPDPTGGGVREVALGPAAFALSGPGAPPLLATRGGAAVLTRLQVGEGSLWILSDPSFFTNASIGSPGHLQLLANLIADSGGRLTIATWPTLPWHPTLPNPGNVTALLLALVPGLLLVIWALGARFGAVRRSARSRVLAPEDRAALGWMMRRRSAGRLALKTLFEEERGPLPAELSQEITYRLSQGPVGARELRQWQRRLNENGGKKIG